MSYISAALRKQVTDRADSKCEYCQFPQALSFFTFEMEHIISEKHDGETNHFRFEGLSIVPLTAEGRVTTKILQFNSSDRISERTYLM